MNNTIHERRSIPPFRRNGGPRGEALLVTEDAPAYGVLAGVRALRARGYRPWVAVAGASTYSARSRAREGTVLVPDPAAGVDRYVSALAEIASELGVAAVLPGTENGLVALAGSDDAFSDDVVVGAPSRETVWRVTDKAVLVELAPQAGLQAPPTLTLTADALDPLPDVEYPAIVKTSRTKTRAGDGTIRSGMVRRVDTPDELRSAVTSIQDANWLIQPYIRGALAAVSGVAWRGQVVCSHHQVADRIYPVDCGISAYARSVARDPELDRAIARLVDLLDWSGLFQVQLVRRGENVFVIDMNPRMYGSLALAVAAGLNLPAIWVDMLLGRQPLVGHSRRTARYRSEERDAGALWAAFVSRDWRGLVSGLVPHRGTTHAIFSMRDPFPVVTTIRRLQKERGLIRARNRNN